MTSLQDKAWERAVKKDKPKVNEMIQKLIYRPELKDLYFLIKNLLNLIKEFICFLENFL